MAAGVPVVGVDASGVREVIDDYSNGRLLPYDDKQTFSGALHWVSSLSGDDRKELSKKARQTARAFGKDVCADKALERYAALREAEFPRSRDHVSGPWDDAMRRIKVECDMVANIARATSAVLESEEALKEEEEEGE